MDLIIPEVMPQTDLVCQTLTMRETPEWIKVLVLKQWMMWMHFRRRVDGGFFESGLHCAGL